MAQTPALPGARGVSMCSLTATLTGVVRKKDRACALLRASLALNKLKWPSERRLEYRVKRNWASSASCLHCFSRADAAKLIGTYLFVYRRAGR